MKGESGGDVDADLRTLKVVKSNYGPIGAEMKLRWQGGVFRLEGGGGAGFHRVAVQAEAERVFLELLITFRDMGREVTDKTGAGYAPAKFAEMPAGLAIGKPSLAAAMVRLFAAGRIRVETYGPPSRLRTRLVEV